MKLAFPGEPEEGIAYMNVSRFIKKVDEKKREILKQSKLNNAELHMFMAGMNSAMEAIEEGGGDCCGWIPVTERLPEKEVRVLVTIMHHKWIADPGHRDQCTHPEWLETCEARYIDGKEWEYANQECEYEMISAFSAIGDLNHTYPIDEVLAWMPLPEPYHPEVLREVGTEAGQYADAPVIQPAT